MYDQQHAKAASVLSAAARVAQHGDGRCPPVTGSLPSKPRPSQGSVTRKGAAVRSTPPTAFRELTGPASPGGWLRFDGSRLAEERGGCYLTLGHTGLAEASLTGALDHSVSLRRRGSLLTDLAVLGIQRRDLGQLLHYAETP